jgi:hypothetical protein
LLTFGTLRGASDRIERGCRISGWRHHPREIQRLVFVATHAERRCRDGSIIAVTLAEGPELPCRRWLPVQFVAAERVDVRVRDRRDATERLVVGDDVGLGGVEVVDRGGHVPRVPDLDGVDEDLEAERVPAVVIFVSGDLRAGADHDVPAQRVERLALLSWPWIRARSMGSAQ